MACVLLLGIVCAGKEGREELVTVKEGRRMSSSMTDLLPLSYKDDQQFWQELWRQISHLHLRDQIESMLVHRQINKEE